MRIILAYMVNVTQALSQYSRSMLFLLTILLTFQTSPIFAEQTNSNARGVVRSTSSLGAALQSNTSGRQITFDLYIENLGSTQLDTLSALNDLDAVFGAGNYAVISAPVRLSGPTSVSGNSAFDGSSNKELLAGGGTLDVGMLVRIQWTVEISTVVDMGGGLGVYSNQISVTSTQASDLSDSGTEPDANGNNAANDAGEDDPTVIALLENPKIGLAKTVSLNGTQVTFDFYLKNLGNVTLLNLSLVDDLDTVFGAGNYMIVSAPSLMDDPGSISLNSSYDGSTNANLISSGSLTVDDTAQIRVVINVTTVSDQGIGLGVYSNQATAAGMSTNGKVTEDLSDHGMNPDPQPELDNPTPFTIGEESRIGAALAASVNGNQITLDYYLENLGNAVLDTITLENDLNAVFGAGNYYVNTTPILIDDPGTLQLNTAYDGSNSISLIQSENSTLAPGDTAQIRVSVTLVAISDQGLGTGIYANQVLVTATAPGGTFTGDYSDDGIDPDPSGDGDPTGSNENDATAISVSQSALLGVALNFTYDPVTKNVTILYYLENFGNVVLSSLQIENNLNAVFGAGNFSHIEDPSIVAGTALHLTMNAAYNGNTNTLVFGSGSWMAPGETAIVKQVSRLTNITDQGFGLGIYQIHVTATATDPSSNPVSDLSDWGIDPDPNANGDPTESGENDVTVIDVNSIRSLGVALDVSVNANEVTLDYYLENLGNEPLDMLSLNNDLDAVFGAGNYAISTPPQLVTDPGTLVLNSIYDGSNDKDILVPESSALTSGTVAQIRMQILVTNVANNQGLGIGSYSNQATLLSVGTSTVTTDLSDFGTDPDPSGNGLANDSGENDATTFQVPFDAPIGVAQTVNVTGSQVTFDLYLENFGTGATHNVSLTDELDSVFGAGNYTIITPPAFIDDPGTLVLNGAYDGSGDSQLLVPGSSTLGAGDTAQIQMELNVSVTGNFESQAIVTGSTAAGVNMTDLSDDGMNPDPSGDNDPSGSNENDINIFIVGTGSVGIAMQATVVGTQVYFDYTVENLGTIPLTNFLMSQPLNPVFGSGNYSIQSQPTLIDGPATLSLSPQFFGFNIFDRILLGGDLQAGETVKFRTIVSVNTVTDVGNGFGIYSSQVTVNANDVLGTLYSDVSDAGFVPDSDGNGNPGDVGEDDTTWIIIGDEARLGAALNATVSGDLVTFDIYLENFGGSTLSSINTSLDLDAVFGTGNYTISSGPALIDDPGTINLNAGFDGNSSTAIIDAGSTLAALDTAQIRIVVQITNRVDVGLGLGSYQAQVVSDATAPLGTQTLDLSDSGIDPDSNGNGIPWDGDENDVTVITVEEFNIISKVGVAQAMTAQNGLVNFDFYIENFGTTDLHDFSMPLDLDAIFGAGNYALKSIPEIVGGVRNLSPNTSFDGSSDKELIFGSLNSDPTTTVLHLEVQLNKLSNQGYGMGVYHSQVTISAQDPSNTPVSDLSDDGTDPDPDNDENPDEAGENDANSLTIVNNNPIANDDTINILEDSLDNVLDVLANDSDADTWQTLTITAVGTPDNGGVVSINGGNRLLYSPGANYSGSESFSYTISDSSGGETNATVNILISNVNDQPVNTALPVISGTVTVGNTLTTTNGSWTDADNDVLNYTYQWLADSVAIGGATSSSYILTSNEAHKTITVTVTAHDALASVSATSASVSANNTAPTYTALPVISGTALVGNTLSTTNGTWTDADNDAISYSYQWLANSVAISGATASSYLLTSNEAHKTITVRVIADDNTTTTQATSMGTVVANTAPSNSVLPQISGSTIVGSTLSTSNGTWIDLDNDTLNFSYQWFANGLTISGATSNSYLLTLDEAYKTITVRVTTDDGFITNAATSAATAQVGIEPVGSLEDRDYDNIADLSDNCPNIANPLQGDLDSDGIGNVCDPEDDRVISTPIADQDNDGIEDITDNCPLIANKNQSDIDGNGVGDVCDSTSSLQLDNNLSVWTSGAAYSGPLDPGGFYAIAASIDVTVASMPTVAQGEPTPPSNAVAPVNIVSDSGGVLGYMITVVFTIPEESASIFTGYWKYGKETQSDSDHWYDYGSIVENNNGTGYSISADGKTMTVSLFDGLRGDNDLIANGTITDPGVPIVRSAIPVPMLGTLGIVILTMIFGLFGIRRLDG